MRRHRKKIQKKKKNLCKGLDKPNYMSYFMKKGHPYIVFIRISLRKVKRAKIYKEEEG
jgi:hypothetical protein